MFFLLLINIIKDVIIKCKDLLRQIEELAIEEIILNEISLSSFTDEPIQLESNSSTNTTNSSLYYSVDSISQFKPSFILFNKWKSIIEKSNIDDLKSYLKEADYFFNIQTTNTHNLTTRNTTFNQEETDIEIESYETAITNINNKDTDKSILIDAITEESLIEQEQIEKIFKNDSLSNNLDEIINKTIEIETIHHIEIVEISKIDRHHSQRLDLAELHKIENNTIEMNESLNELNNNNNVNLNIENTQVKADSENNIIQKDVNVDKYKETTPSKLSETSSTPRTTSSSSSNIGEPVEFIKCIEKLIYSTQTVDKHLDNVQRANKEFVEFEKQNLKLSAIKQTLESLTLAIKTSILHKQAILEKSDQEKAKQIGKLFVELTKLHQNVVHKYKEKNALYLKNYDQWSQFDKDYQNLLLWLNQTTEKLNETKASNLESSKLQEIIKVININQTY